MTTIDYFSFIQALVCDASHTTKLNNHSSSLIKLTQKKWLSIGAKFFKIQLNAIARRVFKIDLFYTVNKRACGV